MTYYIHRNGIIRKTWLRMLNVCLIIMIPTEAYYWKKEIKESYLKCLKTEIEVWKQGFKFGE